MDEIRHDPRDDFREPPMVIPVEPPLALPAKPITVGPERPGPGLFAALLWLLLLVAVQVGAGIVLAIILLMIQVIRHGPESAQAAAGSGKLLDLPGATLVLFLAGAAATILTGVAAAAIMFRRAAPRVLALRRLSVRHALLIMLLVPPFLLLASEVQTLAARVLPHLGSGPVYYGKLSQQNWLVVLVAGCLLPALGEELYFRGFLGRGLVARHGVGLGMIFTAALFGAMHLDPPQVVGTALLGVAFQVVFFSTKSLWGPVLFHGLNNALAFGLMRLANAGRLPGWLGVDEEHVPPLLLAASVTAVVALGWLLWAARTRWVLPGGGEWSPGYVTAETPPALLGATPRLSRPPLAAVLLAAAAYALFAAALAHELRGLWA